MTDTTDNQPTEAEIAATEALGTGLTAEQAATVRRRMTRGEPPAPPEGTVSLEDRASLNVTDAYYSGTLAGSARLRFPQADQLYEKLFGDAEDPAEAQELVRDRLAAYKALPGAQGLAENVAALSGQIAGSIPTPEALLAPEVKFYQLGKAGVEWAGRHPVMARIFGRAIGQGLVNVGTDPFVQNNLIAAGVEEHFNWLRVAAAFPMGVVMGAGFAGAGELRRMGMAEITGRPQLPPPELPSITERVWTPPEQPGPRPGETFDDFMKRQGAEALERATAARETGDMLRERLGLTGAADEAPVPVQRAAEGAPAAAGTPEPRPAPPPEPRGAVPEAAIGPDSGFVAYHGSPHDFDRFDISRIGSGEGAQSYGHGLYLAENRAVAGSYAERLSNEENLVSPRAWDDPEFGPILRKADADYKLAEQQLADAANSHDETAIRRAQDEMGWASRTLEARIKDARERFPTGAVYQVRITANRDHFLDWDKPLSEQSAHVKAALRRFQLHDADEQGVGLTANDLTGREVLEQLAQQRGGERMLGSPGKEWGPVPYNDDAAASHALRAAGIPGIRYLDQGSRPELEIVERPADYRAYAGEPKPFEVHSTDGNIVGRFATRQEAEAEVRTRDESRTSNFVVFDDKLIQITHKNDQAVTTALESAGLSRSDFRNTDLAAAAQNAETMPPVQAIETATISGALARNDVTPEQINAVYGQGTAEQVQAGAVRGDGATHGVGGQDRGREGVPGTGEARPAAEAPVARQETVAAAAEPAEVFGARTTATRPTFAPGRPEAGAPTGGAAVPEVVSPQQSMRRLADVLDAYVSDQKLHIRGALGEYEPGTATVRLKNVTDPDIFAHEIGHHIEFRIGTPLQDLARQSIGELSQLVPSELRAGFGPDEMRAEGFAEYMNRFALSEDAAIRDAPAFTSAFTDFMRRNHPEMLAEIVKFRDAYSAWERAPNAAAIDATIVEPRVIAAAAQRETSNPMQRSAAGEFFYKIRRSLFDTAESFNEMRRALHVRSGEIVHSVDDAAVRLRQIIPAAEKSTEVDYTIGIGGRPHEITVNGQKKYFALGDIVDGFTTDPNSGIYDPVRSHHAGVYLSARHALVLIDEYRNFATDPQGNLLRERRPTQFSYASYAERITQLEAQYPDFHALADMFSVVHADDTIRRWKAGLITPEQRDHWLRYRTYAPFARDMRLNETDILSGGVGGKSTAMARPESQRLRGSDRDVINPLASYIRQIAETNTRIRYNDFQTTLASMVKDLGPEGKAIGEDIITTRMTGTNVDVIEAMKRKLLDLGMTREDIESNIGLVQDMLNGSDAMTTIFRTTEAGPSDIAGRVLWRRENGELKAMVLRDTPFARDIYSAIEMVGKRTTDMISRAFTQVWNVQRVAATGNPTFAMRNLIRDPLTRVLNDPRIGSTGTVLDWIPGLPSAKSFLTGLREMFVIAADDAIHKVQAVERYFGRDAGGVSEHAPSPAETERNLLRREGLIGETNYQYMTSLLGKARDPLEAIGLPGYNIGERPALSVVAAALRGLRNSGGIGPSVAETMKSIRQIVQEKYGPDAPALGLRMARDFALDAGKAVTVDPIKAIWDGMKYLAEISEPAGRMTAARDILHYELQAQSVSRQDYQAFLRDTNSVAPEVQGKILTAIGDAVAGSNGTANFQRRGDFPENYRMAMFFNSNIQGLAAHGETVRFLFSPESAATTPKQEAVAGNRYRMAWQLSSLITGTFLYAMMKTQQQDERWQNMPEWKRRQVWAFPINAEINATLDKPFEWRAYLNVAEALGQYVGGKGEFTDFARGAASALQDGLTPPWPFAMGALTEIPAAVSANYDPFRRRRIVPEVNEKLLPQYQYDQNTTGAAMLWTTFWNRTMESLGMGDVPEQTKNSLAQVFFSPQMADYVGKSILAGAYTDLRGAVLDPLAGRQTDPTAWPITRALLSKSLVFGQARTEISENVSRHGGQLTGSLEVYLKLAREGGDAGAFFANLQPDRQAYVAMMAPERRNEGAGVKRLHPMERMRAVSTVLTSVARMVDQGKVAPLNEPLGGFTVTDPALKSSLRDTIARIHEMEARNTLILSGDQSWRGAGYKVDEVGALYDKLHTLDERVYNEVANRYATERVFKFTTLYNPASGSGIWPGISDRLRQEGGAANLRGERAAAAAEGFELEGSRVRRARVRPAPPPMTVQP